MARIAALRTLVRNEFLKNNIISGNEAKELIKEATEGGVTGRSKQQLQQLRGEFQSQFSSAGLREFDKAFAKLSGAETPSTTTPATGGHNAVNLRGADLSHLPTSFKLSEVRDPDVKRMLRRMDLNIDGKVDAKDQKKLGFSDAQFRTFIFAALLSGPKYDVGTDVPQDLSGKTIAFSAVPDKAAGIAMARAMGATIADKVDANLDFLIVGSDAQTGKDERAHAFNVLGQADISVSRWSNFTTAAERGGAIPQPTTRLSAAEYRAASNQSMTEWYNEFVRESYEDDFENATTAEKVELRADMADDLVNGFDFVTDSYAEESVDEQYEWHGPYLDAAGLPIPRGDLDVRTVSMFTNFAGIGLSKTFVFDKRNANIVDEFDIQD